MDSLILRSAARLLLPLLLLFSIFLLLRGHNEPGGGFSGGLVAAAAFALLTIATDVPTTRRTLRMSPRVFIGAGLLFPPDARRLPLLPLKRDFLDIHHRRARFRQALDRKPGRAPF